MVGVERAGGHVKTHGKSANKRKCPKAKAWDAGALHESQSYDWPLGRVPLWNRDSAGIKQSQQLKNTYLNSQGQNLNSTYKGCVGKKARKCRKN